MRTEGAFDLHAIDHFWSGPALGRSKDDHWPAWARAVVVVPRIVLNLPDVVDDLFHGGRHELMHRFGIISFNKVGRPSAASQKLLQLLMLDTSQYGRVTDLVAIEVQNRQHGPIGTWVQELVGLPRGSQRTRFCLTIADDAGDDQTWIVERSPEGMAERVSEF